jgi:hypothetical protein
VLGLITLAAGSAPVGGLLLLGAVALGLYARHWLGLVGRSRVGARSEDEVKRTLAQLEAEGWRLRHSLWWGSRGDIDSVAISPTGLAFARRRRERTMSGTSLACASRRRGYCVAGGDGAATVRYRSCASFELGQSSMSRPEC